MKNRKCRENVENNSFTCMGAHFEKDLKFSYGAPVMKIAVLPAWELCFQGKRQTCLGNGTGSAFKGEGLQSNGLKAVLDTAVVFGRACGAASTTLPGEKTPGKP